MVVSLTRFLGCSGNQVRLLFPNAREGADPSALWI
jgi:hypothetical protein